jgi:hypothetical protein
MGRRRGGDRIHNRKKELQKRDFKRRVNNKKTVPDIIIACEDSVSSPTYFRMIVAHLIQQKIITQDSFVIAKHKHSNPMGVLKDLKNYKDENGKTYKDFDHKWIVIDRDIERVNGGGHKKEDFNNALINAKSSKSNLNIEVAYSNDSFELWYLLHFVYRNTPISRDEILKQVIQKLKEIDTYKFASLTKENIKKENYTRHIFETLNSLQDDAIRNAQTLLLSYGENHNPESDNPSTRVHELVQILKNLEKLGE